MATPNQLVAALEQARHALTVNLGGNLIVEDHLRTGNQGSAYCLQEIAKIDAVLNAYYKEQE